MLSAFAGASQTSVPPELPNAEQAESAREDSTRVPQVFGQCVQLSVAPSSCSVQPRQPDKYVPGGSPSALAGPSSTGLPPPHPAAANATAEARIIARSITAAERR